MINLFRLYSECLYPQFCFSISSEEFCGNWDRIARKNCIIPLTKRGMGPDCHFQILCYTFTGMSILHVIFHSVTNYK